MSLSVLGVPSLCEKFPHTANNFWPIELISNQFFVVLRALNALCVCLRYKHPRLIKQFWYINACSFLCHCGRVAVASPELLTLTEGFLGIASVCLALAVWRFCNKSLGRLCHARHASAWGSSHRVPCCRACLRMGEWLPQDCCELAGRKRLRAPLWDIPLLRAVGFL
jgi:hypothetical protein